jgi:hypothetical protein
MEFGMTIHPWILSCSAAKRLSLRVSSPRQRFSAIRKPATSVIANAVKQSLDCRNLILGPKLGLPR